MRWAEILAGGIRSRSGELVPAIPREAGGRERRKRSGREEGAGADG